jgi:hypothetical protein
VTSPKTSPSARAPTEDLSCSYAMELARGRPLRSPHWLDR